MHAPHTSAIDRTDLNSAHALAVLLVPPGSNVLTIGTEGGSLARSLGDRGCRVWGIERDHSLAAGAEPWCERVFVADVEQIDWPAAVEGARFDVVLMLGVLEQLRAPVAMLMHAARLLQPGGHIVATVRNASHKSVRRDILDGRFRRTPGGLIDTKYLQLFDRADLDAVLRAAGLQVFEQLRVVEPCDSVDRSHGLDREAASACPPTPDDTEGDTSVFVVAASPQSAAYAGSGVSAALQAEVHRGNRRLAEQEALVDALTAKCADLQQRLDQATGDVDSLRTGQVRAAAALDKANAAARDLERQNRLLLKDVLVKDAYLAELRAGDARQSNEILQAAEDHSRALAVTHARGGDLQALRDELAAARFALDESRQEIAGYQKTLGLLRYRAANRLNQMLRRFTPMHRFVKDLLARRLT